ncbi:MAG: hypothetical protein NC339_00390 [Muribaculaceae bacterium]|nr:hypothetical protein [Muribaculaceae bacterium]
MIEKYQLYVTILLVTLWASICVGFVEQDVLPFLTGFKQVVFFVEDFIFIILGLIALSSRRDILILLSLLVIVAISSYLNRLPLSMTINGLRSYIALVMCIPIIRYLLTSKNAGRFIKTFDKQLMILLYLQGACVMLQFFKYGPSDYDGGLFGDGGTGPVSTFIYITSFYFLSKRWDFSLSFWQNVKANKIFFILLLPTFFNETKISFVFIAIYIVLLFPIDKKYILRVLCISPFMILILVVAGWTYINITKSDQFLQAEVITSYLTGGEDVEELMDLAIRVQDAGLETDMVWAVDLPRFMKLSLVKSALKPTKGGMMFGAGVGQFKGGSVMGKTEFSKKNKWMMSGTLPSLFWVLIDLGIVGTIWLLVNLVSILLVPDRRMMGKNIKIYIALIWLAIMFYDQQITVIASMFVMFYILMEGMTGANTLSEGGTDGDVDTVQALN